MEKHEVQLLNVQKAAASLGVNANTIRRWASTKKLNGLKVGSRGDWRFTKTELLKMIKRESFIKDERQKFHTIEKLLVTHANEIQRLATMHHRDLLGSKQFRSKIIDKYKNKHIVIVEQIAKNLETKDIKKGTAIFKKLGEKLASDSVRDKLTIEEAVDGIIFLKQAIWQKLDEEGLLNELTAKEFYQISQAVGTFCDVVASKIAFTYHQISSKLEDELVHIGSFVASTSDAIWSISLDGKVINWNKGAEHLYGYNAEEIIGKSFHVFVPTDTGAKFKTFIKKLRNGVTVESHDTLRITKAGRIIEVSVSLSPIKNSSGKIEAISIIGRDITERKQLEHNLVFLTKASRILATSLDYETTLANVAKLAVPDIADWCSVEMVDDGMLKQVAITHKDPKMVKLAKSWRKKYPPDQNEKQGTWNVIRTGKPEYFPLITDNMLVQGAKDAEQLRLLRKLRFTSAMSVPILTSGKAIGTILFVASEKERYYTKDDLDMAKELSHRASLAIENAKLYTDAQKAITLRNEFITVASHELKTPVTSLKMYTQVLERQLERKGDKVLAHRFSIMDEQIDKLSKLIGDLLDVSKIQHGKLEFDLKKFNLNELVKEIVKTMQDTSKKHTIVIKGKIRRTMFGDKYRIYQVITNLLTNAIKYSPHENKVIVQLTPEKNSAVVTVQDFGIGIESDQLKKVFNQYYRVTNSEEKTFPGLGMGLYISNEIVKRHGGKMSVISSRGKGSQFTFTLPYIKKVIKR